MLTFEDLFIAKSTTLYKINPLYADVIKKYVVIPEDIVDLHIVDFYTNDSVHFVFIDEKGDSQNHTALQLKDNEAFLLNGTVYLYHDEIFKIMLPNS